MTMTQVGWCFKLAAFFLYLLRKTSAFTASTQSHAFPQSLPATTSLTEIPPFSLTNRVIFEQEDPKWRLRAFWMAQELLITFQDELDVITILPSSIKDTWTVQLLDQVLWDSRQETHMELKVLKQKVRDLITPNKSLGHGDPDPQKEPGNARESTTPTQNNLLLDLQGPVEPRLKARDIVAQLSQLQQGSHDSHHLTIAYCTGCRWLLRAAYVGQEVVHALGPDHALTVSLVPTRTPLAGGAFLVLYNDIILWDRQEVGRFPESEEIVDLLRPYMLVENQDDDRAEELRRYFGVM